MIHWIRHIATLISEQVHNPASTLSNLAFIAFGWQLFHVHWVFALLMIGVGIGSTGFHWHRDDCWHKVDIVMIYYMFSILAGWLSLGNPGIVVGIIIGVVAHWSFSGYSRYSWQIIGALGAATLLPLWIGAGWSEVYPVLIWFGLSFATSTTATYFEPNEDGPIYDAFHAIWHIFAATGIYEIILTGTLLTQQ